MNQRQQRRRFPIIAARPLCLELHESTEPLRTPPLLQIVRGHRESRQIFRREIDAAEFDIFFDIAKNVCQLECDTALLGQRQALSRESGVANPKICTVVRPTTEATR